jgi:hypothetical protein
MTFLPLETGRVETRHVLGTRAETRLGIDTSRQTVGIPYRHVSSVLDSEIYRLVSATSEIYRLVYARLVSCQKYSVSSGIVQSRVTTRPDEPGRALNFSKKREKMEKNEKNQKKMKKKLFFPSMTVWARLSSGKWRA